MSTPLRKRNVCIAILLLFLAGLWMPGQARDRHNEVPQTTQNSNKEPVAMKILLKLDGQSLPATLDNSPAARDFFSLLPLTLTLEDYAATEKIAYLPRKLSIQEAPAGIDPDAGDITYYAPWGNLAIFHRDFRYSPGLVHLGRIEGNIDALRRAGKRQVTITVAD
jgi:hypothetical protein